MALGAGAKGSDVVGEGEKAWPDGGKTASGGGGCESKERVGCVSPFMTRRMLVGE